MLPTAFLIFWSLSVKELPTCFFEKFPFAAFFPPVIGFLFLLLLA
jgi:hypothetical protein